MTENSSWESYVDALRPIADRLLAKAPISDELARQELHRLLFSAVAQGVLNYVWSDPDYPDFKPGYDTALNLAGPVPDFRYKVTMIDGHGVYRISGFRGTSRFVDITVFSALFSLGTNGPVLDRISLDDLALSPAGEFELILSKDRPDGYGGEWRALDPCAIRLQVRHASYDWRTEVDARMAIERVDRPARRPREGAEQISAKLSRLAAWAENSAAFGIEHVGAQRARGIVNKVETFDWSKGGGFNSKVQIYQEGLFSLAADEAIILEAELPEVTRYWSVMLTDDQFATIDWVNHQSSLNGHQATIDEDGRFRGVISDNDPGVPNWLDPAGRDFGLIQFRWNECSSIPSPTVKLVKLAQLREHLPKNTPFVSPEERDQALRHRRQGAQMRSRW